MFHLIATNSFYVFESDSVARLYRAQLAFQTCIKARAIITSIQYNLTFVVCYQDTVFGHIAI